MTVPTRAQLGPQWMRTHTFVRPGATDVGLPHAREPHSPVFLSQLQPDGGCRLVGIHGSRGEHGHRAGQHVLCLLCLLPNTALCLCIDRRVFLQSWTTVTCLRADVQVCVTSTELQSQQAWREERSDKERLCCGFINCRPGTDTKCYWCKSGSWRLPLLCLGCS